MDQDIRRSLDDMEDLDEVIIAKKPWAQSLLSASLQMTKKAVLNWCNTIVKIGESHLDLDEYVSIYLKMQKERLEDLIADVDNLHEKTVDKIAAKLEHLQDLCKDLHVNMPDIVTDDSAVCDVYERVNSIVDDYESTLKQKLKEIHELKDKESKLCKNLGKKAKEIRERPLPTEKEVEELRLYVEELENEAITREEKYYQLKENISRIVEELQYEPLLQYEKDTLNLTDSEVRITEPEMQQLEQCFSRLSKLLQSTKEEIADLRTKIDGLWDKLETDIADRDAFRQRNTGNSLKVLEALKVELRRLEEIKKENMKVFVGKQRDELVDLWVKCHTDVETQKSRFGVFYSEVFNEDLFELHDLEIQKWKNYYEENQEIFVKLEEYKRLWAEQAQLDLNSGGKNRYKNRGGQLLQEEKKRNRIRKRLPKLEQNLLTLAEVYFTRAGTDFLSHGLTVQQLISSMYQQHTNEVKQKLSAKKQQRDQQLSSVGKSKMNLFPSTSTALYPTLTPNTLAAKRKLLTPCTEPLKKVKVSGRKRSSTGLPKLNVSRRRSQKRNNIKKKLSFTKNKENCEEPQRNYNDFVDELSKSHKVSRSTEVGVTPLKREPTFIVPKLQVQPATPLPVHRI